MPMHVSFLLDLKYAISAEMKTQNVVNICHFVSETVKICIIIKLWEYACVVPISSHNQNAK